MPKNPYNNVLFDHIDGFEFFLNFLCLNFELSSPTPRGDNRHNRPWGQWGKNLIFYRCIGLSSLSV